MPVFIMWAVPAVFSAGCMLATDKVVPAEQFLTFLRSPEAAAVLRCSTAAVRSLVARGMETLRELVVGR